MGSLSILHRESVGQGLRALVCYPFEAEWWYSMTNYDHLPWCHRHHRHPPHWSPCPVLCLGGVLFALQVQSVYAPAQVVNLAMPHADLLWYHYDSVAQMRAGIDAKVPEASGLSSQGLPIGAEMLIRVPVLKHENEGSERPGRRWLCTAKHISFQGELWWKHWWRQRSQLRLRFARPQSLSILGELLLSVELGRKLWRGHSQLCAPLEACRCHCLQGGIKSP